MPGVLDMLSPWGPAAGETHRPARLRTRGSASSPVVASSAGRAVQLLEGPAGRRGCPSPAPRDAGWNRLRLARRSDRTSPRHACRV